MDRQTYDRAESHKDRKTNKRTDMPTIRQTEAQTDKEQTNQPTDRQAMPHLPCLKTQMLGSGRERIVVYTYIQCEWKTVSKVYKQRGGK